MAGLSSGGPGYKQWVPVEPNVLRAIAAALDSDPDNLDLARHLAELELDAGEDASALDHARRVLDRHPADEGALVVAARAARRVGDEAAADGYDALLSGLRGDASAPAGAPPREAEVVPLRAVPGGAAETGPDEVERPSLTLAEVGGLADVKRRLEAAFLAPMRTHALLLGGRPAEALEAADGAAGLSPDDEWPHRLRALALLDRGRKADALRAAREAVRLAPDGADAHYVLARALDASRRFEEARASAERVLELKPESSDGYVLLGDIARNDKCMPEAIRHYQHALWFEPNDASVHNNFGLALQWLGRHDEARRAFRNAARLDPRLDVARRNLIMSARMTVWAAGGAIALVVVVRLVFIALTAGDAPFGEAAIAIGVILAVVLAVGALVGRSELDPGERQLLRDHRWWRRRR